jgi:hypothetical protein
MKTYKGEHTVVLRSTMNCYHNRIDLVLAKLNHCIITTTDSTQGCYRVSS